ncbi:MAG: uncharacterized protein A8A55_0090 [Amphiamblys sp. WSBS2006]|nr:MAG: uncharacterized protein A8A55_0090 [Amphiamblys sp. WSBS2006]
MLRGLLLCSLSLGFKNDENEEYVRISPYFIEDKNYVFGDGAPVGLKKEGGGGCTCDKTYTDIKATGPHKEYSEDYKGEINNSVLSLEKNSKTLSEKKEKYGKVGNWALNTPDKTPAEAPAKEEDSSLDTMKSEEKAKKGKKEEDASFEEEEEKVPGMKGAKDDTEEIEAEEVPAGGNTLGSGGEQKTMLFGAVFLCGMFMFGF